MKKILVRVSALINLLFSTLAFAVIQNGRCPEPLRLPDDEVATVMPDSLSVGMQINFDPVNGFNFTDPNGMLDGKDVRIACAFAQCLGKRLRIVNVPFDQLITVVRLGTIDIILGEQTRTDARLALIEQVPYGGIGDLTLTFARPAPAGLVSDTDLLEAINNSSSITNKVIAVLPGSVQEAILDDAINRRNLSNLRKVIVPDTVEGASLVRNRNILAFFVLGTPVEPNDRSFEILVLNRASVPSRLAVGPVSAGIRKDNCSLINAFWNWARLNVDLLAQLTEQFTPAFRFEASQVTSFTSQVCELSQFDPCRFANCPWAQAIFNKFCAITGVCDFAIVDVMNTVA